MKTLYHNGSVYQRNNPNGHVSTLGKDHGHLLGTRPGKRGSGESIELKEILFHLIYLMHIGQLDKEE